MRSSFHSAISVCLIAALLPWPAAAKTRKGDILIAKARQAELKDTAKDFDEALALAQEALASDRADIGYQLEVNRLRAFAAQYHVYEGQVLRDKGKVKEALAEFDKAASLDPASEVAPQEVARTKELLNELRRNPSANIDDLLLNPLPRKNKKLEEQFAAAAPVPQLTVKLTKPLPAIKVNNQTASEVFMAVCREAKLRVLFDPDYQNRSLGLNQMLDFQGATLDQVLDYVALVTKSFWKPLSGDTIFVTNDDPMRRSAYEEQVTKAFYLTNAPGAQEVNDIANSVQRITDMRKLQVHPAQSVIIARGDSDRVALAEKIVADLDKPKAEIIIDVVILSVSRNWERQLGMNLLGLADNATNIVFAPRSVLGATQAGGRVGIPLDAIKSLEKGDFNVTLPGAALNALLKVGGTKVLDKAQLRTIEGQKSILRIGQRIPYATGSFSPGAFAGGSSLVNTQFQYFDVGLNIDVIAKVHEPDEVSLHIESDSSAVQDRVDLGGVLQPIISQRKRVADVRVKEGEINFWDIVTQRQDVKASNGLPGLSQIPVLGRVFSNEKLLQTELQVLTLLIPHIIRAPDIRNVNLAGLPSGSDQVVRLRYLTPDGRTVAAQATDRVLELPPGQAMPGAGMGMPGMGGPQPIPGMGGPQPIPGMGGPQPIPGMGGPQPIPGMGGPQPIPGMGGPQPIPGMGGPQPIPGMGGPQPIPGMGGPHPIPGMGGPQPIPGMGGPQPIPGMGGPQPIPGMGGPQPMPGMQTNPGMGVTPPTPGGPGMVSPGPNPMGGMSGHPQTGMSPGPGPTQPGPAPSGNVRIQFQQPVRQGRTVNVDLVMSGPEIASGMLQVAFDPRLLRVVAVNPGVGVSTSPDTGKVAVMLGAGGPRTLCTIVFESLAFGTARVEILPAGIVDRNNATLQVSADPLVIDTPQQQACFECPRSREQAEKTL
ncbi:MAG: hypothetical protein U0Q16_31580 [Bryobacteraceae bacterium]